MVRNDKAPSAVAFHRHLSNGPRNNRQYDRFRLCASVGAKSRQSGNYSPVMVLEVAI